MYHGDSDRRGHLCIMLVSFVLLHLVGTAPRSETMGRIRLWLLDNTLKTDECKVAMQKRIQI